jgi:hypothetical protein
MSIELASSHRLVELLQRHAWRDYGCDAYLSSVEDL